MNLDELLDRWHDGEAGPQDRAEMERLLRDDPEGRRAFVERAALETALYESCPLVPASIETEGLSEPARPRPIVPALAAAVLATVILVPFLRQEPEGPPPPPRGRTDPRSVQAPRDREAEHTLDDGSRMVLSPGSFVFLHGPEGRMRERVELVRGEGRFRVAHAPGEFRVGTLRGNVTVLGTAFTVALRGGGLYVSVAEGRVRVDWQEERVALGAGQSFLFMSEAQTLPSAPSPQDAPPAPDPAFTLRQFPNPRALTLVGAADLPDGAPVRVALYVLRESYQDGRLVPVLQDLSRREGATVKQRGFRVSFAPSPDPGWYQPSVRSGGGTPRRLDVLAWDEAWIDRAARGLGKVDLLAARAAGLVDRFAAAWASEEAWRSAGAALRKASGKLVEELHASDLASSYPAALGRLVDILQNLLNLTEEVKVEDGKLVPGTYYPVKDPDGKAFDLARCKGAVERVSEIAGRELALWGVKERRRSGMPAKLPEEALQRPGVAPFAQRLTGAGAELEVLEKEIRDPVK